MRAFMILILCFFVGCSHHTRSKYASYKKHEGYQEKTENGSRMVNFEGNSYTKVKDAELFANFRAVEICLSEGKKLAHILDMVDRTKKQEIIRSSGGTYPSYYYGMSPYYGRYSNFGMFGTFGTGSHSMWKEIIVTPDLGVVFECSDQVWGPELLLKEISPEQMKLLVKDLKGGLQIEAVLEKSPNSKSFELGDILLKGDGLRLQKNLDVFRIFNSIPNKKSMKVDLLREGVRMSLIMKSTDISREILESQNKIIQLACGYEEIKTNQLCNI